MDALRKLEVIERQIQEYYEMTFDTEQDDYNYNKTIKDKIKQLIVDLHSSDSKITDQALLVLAQSTGCAEDQEIAETIINELHDKKYINDNQLNYFYDNIATGRWM